jgi:HSP20 family protein
MKTKVINILSSKLFQVLSAFIIGGVSTYFVTNYIQLKKQVSGANTVNKSMTKVSAKDPFRAMDDIHNKMMKQMDNAFSSSMFGNSFFDSNSFDYFDHSEVQIEESEDDKFKYITIHADGIDKEAMQINISDGMISISGQIKKIEENKGSNSFSSSSYVSSFNKSFNVPYGVNSDNVKIENGENKIIIKFPKNTV